MSEHQSFRANADNMSAVEDVSLLSLTQPAPARHKFLLRLRKSFGIANVQIPVSLPNQPRPPRESLTLSNVIHRSFIA